MRIFRVFFAIACTLSFSAMSRADRDIVYSARYYNKPGSKGHSHYHLYRINPGGSGKTQITFGRYDDENPQWSPDGKWILFTRGNYDGSFEFRDICVVAADGGRLQRLRREMYPDSYEFHWTPHPDVLYFSHTVQSENENQSSMCLLNLKTGNTTRFPGASSLSWSPVGERFFLGRESSEHGELYNYANSKQPAGTASIFGGIWTSENTMVSFAEQNELKVENVFTKAAEAIDLKPGDKLSWESMGAYNGIQRIPRRKRTILISSYGQEHWRTNSYYKVDLASGTLRHFAVCQEISWSPTAKRFCTYQYWDLADYNRKSDGTMRQVYVAPLQIGSEATGKLYSIVKGLVHVVGCDWRKGGAQI